jgi:hypothetical protein
LGQLGLPLFGTTIAFFGFVWGNGCCPFIILKGQRTSLLFVALKWPIVVPFGVAASPTAVLDNPAIAVRLATTGSEFNVKMSAVDKASNDLLDAVLGHAAFGGETHDTWPGVAFPVIDEVGEHIGQHNASGVSSGSARTWSSHTNLSRAKELFLFAAAATAASAQSKSIFEYVSSRVDTRGKSGAEVISK